MVQQNPQGQQQFQAGPKVNLRELKPGERVKITGDAIIEVIENPQDGMWIRGKYISFPQDPSVEGTEDQIFATDVREMA
jgi:hypothetical protein